jgi:hypothetical protein
LAIEASAASLARALTRASHYPTLQATEKTRIIP